METEEIVTNKMEIQLDKIEIQMEQVSMYSPISELPTPVDKSKTENDETQIGFKIPLTAVEHRPVTALIEVSDGTDYTPSEEKSGSDMDFTPIKQKQSHYDEAMDCDTKEIEVSPIDFFIEKNVIELARSSWRGSAKNQRYLKGCLWSPDGTCLLTTVNGDGMHVFETPRDLYEAESISPERPLDCLQSAVHIKEGGTVYDYCWFPFMNSSDAATCW